MIKNTQNNIRKIKQYLEESNENDITIIDLIRYIYNMYQNKATNTFKEQKLSQLIPNSRKILLVLVDGLGYYKISDLDDESILKLNLKKDIKTVNPTSTACVLTSIASMSYPSNHGIFGWWSHSKKHGIGYYPLLCMSRNGKKLEDEKIDVKELYNFNTFFDSINTKCNIFMSRNFINSDYSKMFNGTKSSKYGTYSITQAFNKVNEKITDDSFNYLYIDGFDMASHVYGTSSKEAYKILDEIEEGITKLKNEHEDTTVIVIADHGQVDMASMIYLNQNHDFSKYFYAKPSIDTRLITFFVKNEYKEEFENKFCEEFSEDVILMKKEEIENYKIFGNNKFSDQAENAIGEYIAVVVNEKFMVCDKVVLEDYMSTKGNHSGLTKEETTVPLIVI